MNIGFDLDKVFIQYPFFLPDFIIDKYYKKKANGKLIYRIPSKPEQLLRLTLHFPIFRNPIKENITFVKTLPKQNGDKHYLISGRFGFLKNKTDKLIRKYLFDRIFDGLYFNYTNNQPHIFKNRIIKKLNVDLYVDDDLQLVKYLSQSNPKVKFFWLNKGVSKKMYKNLFAITHLSQILI